MKPSRFMVKHPFLYNGNNSLFFPKTRPMLINGQSYRTIWHHPSDPAIIQIIDQRHLPHQLVIEDLRTTDDFAKAIREMHVRGAPLIGATAAYGICAAIRDMPEGQSFEEGFDLAFNLLHQTRPTAIDLYNALIWIKNAVTGQHLSRAARIEKAYQAADQLVEASAEQCRMIGVHGVELIKAASQAKKGKTVHILTHCNAGWIACIDYGTATSPIYQAFDQGIDVHVWVDETRPRNQGARITAFELLHHGVPHTVITDNTGGHLMQHGMVDMVMVGTDRTTRQGDVANKIGTYLKALAAKDNHIPFYVTLPSTSFDMTISDGLSEIPIEERSADEVKYIQGLIGGNIQKVLLTPEASPAMNYGFDVTPARLVTSLITERGICAASEAGIRRLFPDLMEARL